MRSWTLLDRLRLDVPVAQAGMGGGLAGSELAAGVAVAGGLGTLGLAPPAELREAIHEVRSAAPDRSVAVNLLMPFVRRSHVEACVGSRIDVAVVAAQCFSPGASRSRPIPVRRWPRVRTALSRVRGFC